MDWRIRFSHWRKQIRGLGTINRQTLRVELRTQVGCGNVHEDGRILDLIIDFFYNCIIFLVCVFYLSFDIKALKIAPSSLLRFYLLPPSLIPAGLTSCHFLNLPDMAELSHSVSFAGNILPSEICTSCSFASFRFLCKCYFILLSTLSKLATSL